MAPEISVVIPCLNEEEAVGAVVDQAWEGIEPLGPTRRGDRGRQRARPTAPPRSPPSTARPSSARSGPGYGSAYLAGLARRAGDYIVMGDADETYPHRASSRRSSTASPRATTS